MTRSRGLEVNHTTSLLIGAISRLRNLIYYIIVCRHRKILVLRNRRGYVFIVVNDSKYREYDSS